MFSYKDEEPGRLVVVQGFDETNRQPQYAVVFIPDKNMDAFRKAEERGNYNLADYGQIRVRGTGDAPKHILAVLERENARRQSESGQER